MHGISGPCQSTQLEEIGLHPSCVSVDLIGVAISIIYLNFYSFPNYVKSPVPETPVGISHVTSVAGGHTSSVVTTGGTHTPTGLILS